jgi:acyl-coenzyme A synthetase/AMP-(fatty) acid ligase
VFRDELPKTTSGKIIRNKLWGVHFGK